MRPANWKKNTIKSVLVIALLVVLLGVFTGCADMGFPAATPPEETPEPEPVKKTGTVINTKDDALLAAY